MLISPIRAAMVPIAATASPVEVWMRPIWSPISWVARVVWLASCFTSAATTAKPRPDSPARAASMVAFSASRLVCPAISEMIETTSPILPAARLSSWTREAVRAASFTARVASRADPST